MIILKKYIFLSVLHLPFFSRLYIHPSHHNVFLVFLSSSPHYTNSTAQQTPPAAIRVNEPTVTYCKSLCYEGTLIFIVSRYFSNAH